MSTTWIPTPLARKRACISSAMYTFVCFCGVTWGQRRCDRSMCREKKMAKCFVLNEWNGTERRDALCVGVCAAVLCVRVHIFGWILVSRGRHCACVVNLKFMFELVCHNDIIMCCCSYLLAAPTTFARSRHRPMNGRSNECSKKKNKHRKQHWRRKRTQTRITCIQASGQQTNK